MLGYPVAFPVILLLEQQGPLTPREIARRVGRNVSTVSESLAKLRAAEVIPYQARGGRPRYWIKPPRETRAFLAGLWRFVHRPAHLRGNR